MGHKQQDLRKQPLGRHLSILFSHFEHELLSSVRSSSGFSSITSADHQILRFIGEEGSSIVEIAKGANVTKQAVSKAVASLEKRDFLARTSDPTDRRAQIITFSPKGRRLYNEGRKIVEQIEKKYANIIGARSLDQVKSNLLALIEDYEGEQHES